MGIRRPFAAVIAGLAALGVAVGGVLVVSGNRSAEAAGTVQTSVSLTAPPSGVYGSTISLAGTVWRTGTSTKLRGVTVYLHRSVRGQNKYVTAGSTRTNNSGNYAFSVKQLSAYDYRVYFSGITIHRAAYSPVRYPYTARYLALDSITTVDPDVGQLRATGHANPVPTSHTTVTLQQYTAAKTWVTIGTGKTDTSGKVTIEANRTGSTSYYRLVIGQAFPYGPGISKAKAFTHYVWRGAFTKHVGTQGKGTLTVRSQAEDSQRASFYLEQSVRAEPFNLYPDITGCVQARTYVSNRDPIGATDVSPRPRANRSLKVA